MLLQWSRQHKALMANKNFPLDPVELKALYNEYVHFKETEIPAKELEKGRVEHLYKLLEVWMEFGRIKLPLGLHPNDLEEEWGKLILEMLEREKALRPAVERLELLLQMANKIQNMALDCEEKLTLAKNTLQADMSLVESGEAVRCERELGLYLQDCEVLIRQLNLDLNILRDEKYYQVEQLAFRASCLHEELVSLRLQCSSVYRKGHFSPVTGGDRTAPRGSDSGLSLSTGAQTLLGAVGVVGAMGAALLRRPMSRSQLVAMSSSEDEGSLRFIYELLGWVEETQDVLERAEWGADLPSVEQNLQDHQNVHTAVEELLHSLKEARNYETKVSLNFRSSYSDTLAKLEHLYCKLLELSSWRLRCLESLHAFVCRCTEELIWLNEREEEELAYDWSQNNTNVNAKRELYAEMRSELEEKQEVMHSLQETADRLCQENHPAKQTVEAYSAALQTQWQWVRQLCVCVEQHLKDNTTYFQFVSDARDCETYLRQLQDTIKRQYTCDKSSRLGKLEDLLQDSMEEKEQLIEYRSSVASLVGRAKTVVQLRPRSAESTLGSTTPIRAICDYRQIEITISRGEECVLADNSQRTKWKVISPSGNEAMVPSVCFTVPPPNQEAMDTASRMEQLYQNVMSLWHNLHVSMKSVVSWHYLQKDIRTVSSWSLDTVRSQTPVAREQALDHLEAHLADFLSDSKESGLFTPTERRELERDAHTAQEHCQDLLVNMETVEKDESVSRSYLSELQNIKLRLEEVEQRLMRGIQTPPPSNRSGDSIDNTVQIAEQEKLQSDLDGLRTSLGEVSRRCVSFFEEKPTSSSVPLLRSELNLAVEKIDRLHNLSSVYLHKLKTVDVLMYSLQAAESQVKRYESRLSEEDIVPADTNAIQALREQLGTWQSELEDQEGVFSSLQSEVQKAREAGTQLNRLHPDRSPELERYQEKAAQLTERWAGVKRQMDTRRGELEALGSVLQQYRDGHSALIHWIEETTERQENTQPGKTDSKVLSEQLAQQTALVADIEKNQTKLDECQTHSKQYCTSVKDYELQLMTFRAFVESTQKSTGKRRRMHSSSDAITQEFMDLRTRYTALVTLTTQHVKYISDALRRLEEEEKEVEEERQQRVGQVSELLGWVKGLQGRAGDPSAESSIAAQEAVSEQLAAKKEEVAKVIRNTQVFLMSKQASKLSPEERAQVTSQLDELTATYSQLCDSSTAQLQQLVQQQAKEEQRKSQSAIGGVIDLGTMETVPVFQAAQRGLIDLDTCHVLLEAQLTVGGLFQPDSPGSLSLEEGLNCGLIDSHISQSLSELESALHLVDQTEQLEGQLLPVAAAMEEGLIKEEVGLRILELQINTGGLKDLGEGRLTLNSAGEMDLLTPRVYSKLCSRVNRRELIDPNTADKLNLSELQQRCVLSDDTGLYLLPVKQQPGGTVFLRSGRKVGIFRAVQEGLIDRQVAVRLLEAQLFAGGISDPRSGHLLTVNEAVRHNLMDQDLACAMLTRQLQFGGILDPVTGDRLGVEEAIQTDLLSPHLALLVLESLWAFIGMLWPESGELLPIAEALQQGVISQELAWNILRQRHAIGALYLPETPKVVSLNQAKEVLEPKVAEILKEIQIPDVLHNMNQSGSPKLNRLIWGSTGTSHPPSSSPGLNCDPSFLEKMAPEEQAHHRLLFHVMTHSYVDAHSGQRLVLLEPELVELVKAAAGLISVDSIPGVVEEGLSLTTERQECMEVAPDVCLPDTPQTREVGKDEMVSFESAPPSAGLLETQVTDSYEDGLVAMESEGSRESGHRKAKEEDSLVEDVDSPLVEALEMYSTPVKPETLMPTQYFKEPDISPSEADEKESVPVSVEVNYAVKDTPRVTEKTLPQVMGLEAAAVKTEEDVELERLASELQQGGLLTEGGQRLLPDEAVAQGVLPGHTAVKLMAKAGLFGGFLDVGACESLSIEDVMQEGLLDEDLMWRVLKSEKTLAGVVDVEKGKICTLKDAAQAGLIDSNTAARLLEAQVVSGGVVDLRRDKKVSVTLAANLGLIEEDQREKLFALEKSCRGKGSDPDASLTKATLQLQMNGVVDPKTKSPVPLRQALERGLLGQEEVYQALSQQVAEGGIMHHNSGVRLSISDALQRGLVDCAISPKLWELERACQGEVALSSNPDAALLQASTGAILDPDLKCRLTLTEAVSDGLLNESIAKKAMVSPGVTEGILDPQSAQIVPYSDLVNQGKIDIKSGKRFLEVKPFKGIQDKQTGEILNLAKAIASQQVDPVPALRMLQSQADTGGIIDISNGARIPLPKASKKGLVGEHMARLIATNQVLKGGLLDPSTGQRVSSLRKAVKDGLISREMAAELQDNLGSMEVERDDEDSSTPVASSSGTYSPADTLSISSPDSQTRQPNQTKPIIIKTSEVISPTPHPEEAEKRYSLLMIAEDIAKTLEAATFTQSGAMQHHGSVYIEDKMEEEQASVAGKSSEIESNQSINLLAQFTNNAEKRLQQALQEMETPQDVTVGTPEKDNKNVIDMSTLVERDEGKTHVVEDSTERVVEQGRMEVEQATKIEARERDDQRHASANSNEAEGKSKKKRKNKKKGKGKEVDTQQRPSEKADIQKTENKDQNVHSEGKGHNCKDTGAESTGGYVTLQEKEESPVQDVQSIVEKSDPDGVETVSQQTGQQEHKDRKAVEFTLKTTPVANDKKALLLKAKESILRKVLGRGVSEKQAAEELVALRQVVGKRESLVTSEEEVKTKVAPDHSTVTVAAEEVKKALEVEKEENVQSDQSKREEEGEKVVLDQIEEVKEEDTSLTDQLKETKSGKKKKNNKKSKMVEKVEPAAEEKPSIHIRADSTPADVDSSVSGDERKTEKQQDGQSDSDVTKVASGDEMNKMAAFTKSPSGVDTNQQRSTHTTAPYQVDVHLEEKTEEDISLGRETDPHGKEIEQFRIGTPEKDVHPDAHRVDIVDASPEALVSMSGAHLVKVSVAPATQPAKTTGKMKKKKQQKEQKLDSPTETESKEEKYLESTESGRSWSVETPQSDEIVESDTTEVPDSDTTDSWKEDGEIQALEITKEKSPAKKGKSSLLRQECLERDQQIMALLSMVRHIEVRVKQQQQQSIGRSLIALDDIIKQTDTLDLELRDLEPQVNKAVDAAGQLLEPRPQEVPPQLLLALEKDGRSLARGYKAARGVSENILQGLHAHRDAYTEALTGEQKSLGGRVEDILSWLKETEAQMTGMDGQTQGETPAQLTQRLQLCKELQSSLSARSNDVNTVAFDIQVFISERAQDLAPEQSRHLLGQLQQLQRGFHQAAGQAHTKADALAAQREMEEERQRRRKEKEEEEKERERAREKCSQKLEGLTMWLAGAASMLANQRAGAESGDVNVLQQKQRELKEVQKDLLTRGEGVAETIRSVEEFLAEHGDSLSPEERANLQGALSRMKEQYSALTDTAQSSLVQLDTAISTTVQQNTQRAKAVEELQETRGQIDSLLEELSSLNQPGMTVTDHLSSSSSTSPEGGLQSHSDMLQAELQQLQAQQAQLMQVSQNARSLLDQPDSAVPAGEKRRLRDQLDQLQTQHQEKLRACQERLRRSEALKDELAKFLQEHGGLGTWLEQSEGELGSLGEGETDAQGLKGRLEEHRKLAEDVICHKADLRFVSISGQKVLDSVQGALEKLGGSDPALEETKQLVTGKLQDANHRYTALHTKSSDLGGRLSGLLERCQQYQDEAVSLHTWLSAQEQNQSIAGPSGETDTQTLQNTLRAVQLLQDELAERSVQLEKVRRSGRELADARESPTLRAAEITSTADGLEKRFSSLSESVSERAEQLQTSVAQSVSVQEGLKGLLAWLDGLLLTPGPVQPTAQAVQDALTQNQKLRQELLSRQGSVEATCDSVSKLLQSSDASTASGLQASLESLTQSYAAAQAKQAEREAELRGLLPKLENYERLSADLQGFTQTCLRALSPVGQPDRSVEDYRQTIEGVRAEQEQEAGHLKSFCQLGTDLSQAKALTSTQTLLDNVRELSDEFARLESNINERYNAIQSCEQQLGQFRSLSGSLLRWLQTTQEQLPLKEPNVNTEALQRRVQQLKDLLSDWEAQGVRVLELNKTGSELETLIINITAPQTKTGVPQVNGAGSPSSVNGIHTCKDLTELQVAVAEVNCRYEELGEELKDRQSRQEASLELRQKARQSTEELSRWLGDRENSLHLGQTAASPSKPEVVRAQAQENKALLSELAEHSGKVKELKSTLEKLIADNPDSPEADTWRQQMKEIGEWYWNG
ncbi:unnamed protein product [Oncorhynchus mykiss]|uniref:SH3 domain-containing protein n=1 Tax=Oncorhynchus mykiss TaxID=8022 RepID=A0A060WDB9_ONCMY|nr:unnamed protein product [Oncorhynchus mykiss]